MIFPPIRWSAAGALRMVACTALIGLCAACASSPEKSAENHDKKVYRTGSNIAVRDRDMPSDVKMVDPESVKQQINSQQPRPAIAPSGR